MVEMRGVEPLSENALTGTSPSAGGHLHSLAPAQADMLKGLVASLCMVRSKLCALMFTTNRRPVPRPWSSEAERSLIKQREEQCYCCSLIYKVPILKMVGASARYSCLHIPVETGTSPFQFVLRLVVVVIAAARPVTLYRSKLPRT